MLRSSLDRQRLGLQTQINKIICHYHYQRWSPRGHGLGLKVPQGQLVMALALALEVMSLALASESSLWPLR